MQPMSQLHPTAESYISIASASCSPCMLHFMLHSDRVDLYALSPQAAGLLRKQTWMLWPSCIWQQPIQMDTTCLSRSACASNSSRAAASGLAAATGDQSAPAWTPLVSCMCSALVSAAVTMHSFFEFLKVPTRSHSYSGPHMGPASTQLPHLLCQSGMPCVAKDERVEAVAADCGAAQPTMTTLPLSRRSCACRCEQ